MMQLAISTYYFLLFLLTKLSYNGPLTFLHAIIIVIRREKNGVRSLIGYVCDTVMNMISQAFNVLSVLNIS